MNRPALDQSRGRVMVVKISVFFKLVEFSTASMRPISLTCMGSNHTWDR